MIEVRELRKIVNPNGNIYHFLKKSNTNDKVDGEVYFTEVLYNKIKAWKYHKKATLNLSVPIGEVRFVFFDLNSNSFIEKIIGENNYKQILIPPKIWFGFQGLDSNKNLIASFSDHIFDENEINRKDVSDFSYDWSIK